MNNLLEPINTLADFTALMENDSDLLGDESFESENSQKSSELDKENIYETQLSISDDEYVGPRTRSKKKCSTKNAKTSNNRSSVAKLKKMKEYELTIVSIGSDDEDDINFSSGETVKFKNPINVESSEDNVISISDTSNEIISLDDDNSTDISFNNTYNYVHEAELLNMSMNVKIMWLMGEGKLYKLRRFQPFRHIFKTVAKEMNIDVNCILLTKNEVKISPADTPESINLDILDILVGEYVSHPVKYSSDIKEGNSKDPNVLHLTLATHSKRDNKRTFTIEKHQSMYILFVKVAEQLECDVDNILLWFDGEKIDPERTAEDLELEGGDCLEVKFKNKEDVCWSQL